jgi:DNA repair exonuclease SbcCD nuclease subunit
MTWNFFGSMATHNKVGLITDTHIGARKGSQVFHDYFAEFYDQVFFPTLRQHKIDTVIHLGDCFDVRKNIDYWSLEWAKNNFFDPLEKRKINLHMLVGNHDSFYKNTLRINAPSLNLAEYDNITIYNSPTTTTIKGVPLFMVPWLCEDNADLFQDELKDTDASVVMGHLQLCGFYANENYQCMDGTDSEVFSKFDRVFTGHFHKKSIQGNITYLGNPYQLYWNDEGNTRGFHILDLDTGELEFIPNPRHMFHKIYYNNDKVNVSDYKNCYVKVIVDKNDSPADFNKFMALLTDAGAHDIKVIENFSMTIDDDIEIEGEDTLTTLTNYINAMEDVNRSNLIGIFKSLYTEAQADG